MASPKLTPVSGEVEQGWIDEMPVIDIHILNSRIELNSWTPELILIYITW